MTEAPLSPDEPFRLRSLRDANLLDTPIEERFERVTRLARRVLDVPIAAVSLVEADRQWFKSIQGLSAAETSRDVSFCAYTILDSETLIVPDARLDPRFRHNSLVTGDPFIVFYAGVPVKGPDGYRIGALCVIDRRPRLLTPDEVEMLGDLAALAETEICTTVLHSVQGELITQIEAEQRRALIDPLTRLWNRDGISQVIKQQWRKIPREASSHGIIMADVDRFKSINDTYGHTIGDQVLQAVARRLVAAIRDSDSVGRYGGEEFLIVPGGIRSPEELRELAQRVRARVEGQQIRIDGTELTVTVSLGAAFCDGSVPVEPAAMIDRADAALYRAKERGRNRVELDVMTRDAA